MEIDVVHVTPGIKEKKRENILALDVIFFRNNPFPITMSQNIKFTTINILTSSSGKHFLIALKVL